MEGVGDLPPIGEDVTGERGGDKARVLWLSRYESKSSGGSSGGPPTLKEGGISNGGDDSTGGMSSGGGRPAGGILIARVSWLNFSDGFSKIP